jgi:hypothetical protein
MLKLLVLPSLSAVALGGALISGPAAAARESAGLSHREMLPPRNPMVSLWPAPSFLASCAQGDDEDQCDGLALAAIDHARQTLEELGGMSFSLAGYEKLSPDDQLFVTVDLERTARGLPAVQVLSRSLDAVAQVGAQAGRDPAIGDVPRLLPGGGRIVYLGATWAGGWVNPLGSDYAWMYDDGPGSSNEDCRTAGSALCWGHRDIILVGFGGQSCGGAGELAMGAGHAMLAGGYGESDTEVIAGVCGPTPTDAVFTWAEAKKLLRIQYSPGTFPER